MSKALLKQAISMCEDDEYSKVAPSSSRKQTTKRAAAMTKKKSSAAKHDVEEGSSEIFLKRGKQTRSLIEKYAKSHGKSRLEANLKYVSQISKPVIKFDSIRAVYDKEFRQQKSTKSNASDDAKSAFTEEDFKSFEKSYFYG